MVDAKRVHVRLYFLTIFLLLSGPLFADKAAVYSLFKETEVLLDEKDYGRAEENCRKILSIDRESYIAYNFLGRIYMDKGEEEKAIDYFSKSIDIYPYQPSLFLAIASLKNKLGNAKEVFLSFEQGLKYNPEDFSLNYNLGLLYLLEKQDPHKALALLNKAESLRPISDKLAYLLGITNLLTGKNFLSLEYVSILRDLNKEYLAMQLENFIRKYSEGSSIDISNVMQVYSNQPDNLPSQKEAVKQNLSIDNPVTKVSGSGTLQIKQQFKK
ncbi:MAG: tetratricopeptide repeat protein [Candidatus Omnitrophota bacterium]